LDIFAVEISQLLGISPRTFRRRLDGEEITGAAEQAIRAWLRLHERCLPWRPPSTAIVEDDQGQIARHREHAIGLSDMIARVEARGGPRTPWTVDQRRCRASFGPMKVSSYPLANAGFSVGSCTRRDRKLALCRWPATEDRLRAHNRHLVAAFRSAHCHC
jgi:hypothetical protein